MKLSIVIPTLNEEKVIQPCLDSLANQKTDYPFEIIIVDSHSKDKTVDIALNYTDKIFYAKPGCIARARQLGSEKSSGQIIVSGGADNIYHKDWLQNLVDPLIKSEKHVATAGKLLPLEGNGLETLFSEIFVSPLYHASILLRVPMVAGESMAFKKDAFTYVGGYRTDLITNEDVDLMKRLMKIGKVSYCPKSIARVSTRRIRKWGYAKYLFFHSSNFIKLHLFNDANDKYEPVR